MATPRCTLQLLFLGLLVSPAFLQQQPCEIVKNTVTRGSFHLDVSPPIYKPRGIYTVTINGIDNSTFVILQSVSSENRSDGLWETEREAETISCSGNDYTVRKNISGNSTRTRWTSPANTDVAPMHIRAFVSFANGTSLMQSRTLRTDLTTGVMTPPPSTATHTTSGSNKVMGHSNSTNAHLHPTVVNHNWASSHQGTKNPSSSASTSPASSVLLSAMQFLPIFLGFKLLS